MMTTQKPHPLTQTLPTPSLSPNECDVRRMSVQPEVVLPPGGPKVRNYITRPIYVTWSSGCEGGSQMNGEGTGVDEYDEDPDYAPEHSDMDANDKVD